MGLTPGGGGYHGYGAATLATISIVAASVSAASVSGGAEGGSEGGIEG